MWYIIAGFIASAGLILGLMSCFSRNQASAVTRMVNTPDRPFDSIKSPITRAELIERLKTLSEKRVPDELSEGAMCYKVAIARNLADYICPVCHKKTHYTNQDGGVFINEQLPYCRMMADSLKQVNCRLDETQFCRHCSPKVERPQLCLITSFRDETSENKVCGVTMEDMQILGEFFSGKVVHRDSYDYESPLKEKIIEITRLLGIEYPVNDQK